MEHVNHPSHYNQGKFEVMDVIDDWKLNFALGNVVKYVARAPFKGNTLEDLQKAKWYLEYEIKKLAEAAESQRKRQIIPLTNRIIGCFISFGIRS